MPVESMAARRTCRLRFRKRRMTPRKSFLACAARNKRRLAFWRVVKWGRPFEAEEAADGVEVCQNRSHSPIVGAKEGFEHQANKQLVLRIDLRSEPVRIGRQMFFGQSK